jgi:hypothetical protein
VEQLAKWTKGNEVWVIAVIHPTPDMAEFSATVEPPDIQRILTDFDSVFA